MADLANEPKTPKQRGGKREGAGRKHSSLTPYADRYRTKPDGSTIIRLPNKLLAQWEAQAEGRPLLEWLDSQQPKGAGK